MGFVTTESYPETPSSVLKNWDSSEVFLLPFVKTPPFFIPNPTPSATYIN